MRDASPLDSFLSIALRHLLTAKNETAPSPSREDKHLQRSRVLTYLALLVPTAELA